MLFSKSKKKPLFSAFDEFSDGELCELTAVAVSCLKEAYEDNKRHWDTFLACVSPSQIDELKSVIEDGKRIPIMALAMTLNFTAPIEEIAAEIAEKYPALKRPLNAVFMALVPKILTDDAAPTSEVQ